MVSKYCTTDETVIADLGIYGVSLPQSGALFDICVMDTDAHSYLCHAPIQFC